ncbi:hypothetical protein ABH937_007651 [Kitasatospora sp. GAS1066B]
MFGAISPDGCVSDDEVFIQQHTVLSGWGGAAGDAQEGTRDRRTGVRFGLPRHARQPREAAAPATEFLYLSVDDLR